jgi:hypothetical protein
VHWDFQLKINTWFRKSTQEWIFEWNIHNDSGDYTCRWSNKSKAHAKFIGIIEMVKDLIIISIKGKL